MRKVLAALVLLSGGSLSACRATAPVETAAAPLAPAPADSEAAAPARAADLLERVDIPYQTFTLDNGLRVIVHEDRKAPVVAVSVWYNVGSKDEPAGRTGFAHLFEHLMFNGSENARGDYFQPLREIGATDLNGTTSFDRTNYFQTVPTSALERALFLESDRMGHLLGAVTQENLTNQIGVVQNEKRQGDNQPYGLVSYAQFEALFPEGHPYRHTPIGSMADLDAATLQTVHEWFRANYGPNNAVLVLAGDVDAATARPLVERYFGDIARGPVNRPAEADIPTLPARRDLTMTDRVANTRLYRSWVVPGMLHEDSEALQVGAAVLGGLSSSRLENVLVRGEQTAVRVSTFVMALHRVGVFTVQVDVKPGADSDAVSRRLDELIAEFIASGPSQDEVQRTVMRSVSGRIQGLEQVGGFGGKAVALAEGMIFAHDPEFYKRRLARIAAVTPEQARSAMHRWLTRPVLAIRVDPGERGQYQEAATVQAAPSQQPQAQRGPQPVPHSGQPARRMPAVDSTPELDFPEVERARLSNGIEVVYARRDTVPVTRVAVEFDAGMAADPSDRLGTHMLMLSLLDEGTTSRNSIQIAEEQERLGAGIGTAASLDRTAVVLTALTPNLAPSLDLLADIVRNPAFAPGEVERLRVQQLASIATEMTQPVGLAQRTLPRILYGSRHPYGKPFTGTGDAESLRTVTRDELVAFHRAWIRPDNARIFAVGDVTIAELVSMLEARFGSWEAPAQPRGTKAFGAQPPAPTPRIVLIDRPQSPQSFILGGQILPVRGTDDLLAFNAANEVLGGNFLSRINMELRERRGWSYGARGSLNLFEDFSPYFIQAPVQADRTGESIEAAIDQLRRFLAAEGVTPAELNRTILGNTRQLPGQFETSSSILGALRSNALYRRPDDYWETVADRYRAMTAAELDQAARRLIDPGKFVWVVVGDAARVRPQLERLGLPIELLAPR
ncbi:M16 family metallopeptidase [Allosphingosinicella sp.]|jgi:predicted Zn-dependent peptidase|uniref:M16 family metallopeptidase n=1 Tax=Allosphingosinicella sp. TaxID=2823234 RepID=UPI002F12EF47